MPLVPLFRASIPSPFNLVTGGILLVGGVLILFVVGDGLIYLFYGRQAALMGLLCLAAGLAPAMVDRLVEQLKG